MLTFYKCIDDWVSFTTGLTDVSYVCQWEMNIEQPLICISCHFLPCFICTIYIIFSVLLSVRGHVCYCGFQLKILYYKGFNFEPHFGTLYFIFLICGSNKWRNLQCNPVVLIASNLYSDTVREHVMCLCCVCVLSYMMLYESINLFYARTMHATRNWSLCLTQMLSFE